ncbi:sensor histidine kinase [Naasia lichenicola]|uniref:Sensor histidine kinase n=1 Tax=Naasia lichenicola TaxID=2565933 RepID=A0A4S4FNB6_9MICO|nr:sensor histidine kinase [Naasia lichenicola]THG30975.1 sensor histidine kinase [Naasia lichenicola]
MTKGEGTASGSARATGAGTGAGTGAAASSAAPSEWHRRALPWWHLAFGLGPAATLGFCAVLADDDAVPLAAVALLSMTVLWFAFGRLSFGSRTARMVFLPLLILALTVAIAAAPNAAVIQCLVFPFIWVSIDGLRSALIGNAFVAIGAFVGFSVAQRGTEYGYATAAAISLVSVAFSVLMGLWITRITVWGHERGRLLEELTDAQAELAAANREQGIASERERLARELHDTIAQSLTGLVMVAQRASAARNLDPAVRADLELIESIGRETLGETRALVASSASVRVEGGLAAAASRLSARYRRETGIDVDLDIRAAPSELDRELEVVVLRCMQEALANVRKHAAASHVVVRIDADTETLVVEVLDDGVGISVADAETAGGFGLSGMRERLALVGGQVTVAPRSTGGTSLRATIPLVRPSAPNGAAADGAAGDRTAADRTAANAAAVQVSERRARAETQREVTPASDPASRSEVDA